MNRKEISDIFSISKVIIDIPNIDQNGLSMRTMEALGAQKKIITTCDEIKNYDFYNPNNHLVLENTTKKNQIIDFLEKPYIKVSSEIVEKYSLSKFIDCVTNNKKYKFLV
tara:strand:- start:166 stop:495 length:330 start_codon:yes stop_codon:yes gene_type:complete